MNPKVSVRVANINIKTRDYEALIPKNPDLKKCLEYARLVHPNPESLLPRPTHRLDFTLTEASPAIANAVRRCLIDELEVQALSFDYEDLETDDPYILQDILNGQIKMIPINQDINIPANKMSLLIMNTGTTIINVMTRDVKDVPANLWEPNICIIKLHPMKYIHIKKFRVIKGKALTNSGHFGLLANVRYSCADQPSVLTSSPTEFNIGYTTYGNIAVLKPMQMCCDELVRRLEIIRSGLDGELPNVRIEHKPANMIHIVVEDESWTLVNLISTYCYRLDPNIPFVCPFVAYTLDNRAVIKIVHPEWKSLINRAIDIALDDIAIIKKAFTASRPSVPPHEPVSKPKKLVSRKKKSA